MSINYNYALFRLSNKHIFVLVLICIHLIKNTLITDIKGRSNIFVFIKIHKSTSMSAEKMKEGYSF